MKNIFYNYAIFILGALLFSNCNSSQSSEAPEIQAAEKEIIESFVSEETETTESMGTTADSLIMERKINLANSANSSPFKEKSCEDILVWLDDAVRNYIATGDTIILNSFINIESDVIFMSCLKSENQKFRQQYDKTLELLE